MDEEDAAMNSGRLSAAEKGKQKVESEGEPAGDVAATMNRHAGGGVVDVDLPRHLLLVPPSGGTSEIEELPPSPPRAAPSRPCLAALDADDAAAAAAGLAVVAGLEGMMRAAQVALDSRLRELEEAKRRRREGGDETPAPEVAVAGAEAEVQMLQRHLGTMQAKLSGMKDEMLAVRFQAEEMHALEEFWKPVVPEGQSSNSSKRKVEEMQALEEFWKPVVPERQQPQHSNNSCSNRMAEEMQALEEFWKPVPVPRRTNSFPKSKDCLANISRDSDDSTSGSSSS